MAVYGFMTAIIVTYSWFYFKIHSIVKLLNSKSTQVTAHLLLCVSSNVDFIGQTLNEQRERERL